MSESLSGSGGVYVLLSDGTTALIRQATPDDFVAVKTMHEEMSPANAYLRFFSLSRTAPEREARRISRKPDDDHAALLAIYSGQVVGVASYEAAPGEGSASPTNQPRPTPRASPTNQPRPTPRASPASRPRPTPRTAEVAFAVADFMHQRGIATLLLEHLVSLARARQITAFTAETLSENTGMLRVFSDAGLPVRTRRAEGTVEITIPLPPASWSGLAGRPAGAGWPGEHSRGSTADPGGELDQYLDTVAKRERAANMKSLAPVFTPRAVAVIGASRRPGTVGRSVLDNIRAAGFEGDLYAINPNARQIGGVPAFPDVASLPETPDLALIAVPPPEVLDAAEACGKRGVRGLIVVTAGLDTAQSADLLASCRRHGMRLIGPNCFGIAVPATGLNATFAAARPQPGIAGLVMKSGGLGFSMIDHLSRLGIGISSFASVGDKLDVSSNDLLMWWERDGVTQIAVLYIESFGNPRKFARTARRVARRMPVLTVHAGRGEDARGDAAPRVSSAALFEQAGVIATPSFGELVEATALLATQRPPDGRTVAIVANVGGAGLLAADACMERGLAVHRPRGATRKRLRSLLPDGSMLDGPVDTTAPVSGDAFRQVIEVLATDEDVHAIIALVLPTGATGDLEAAIAEAGVDVPLAAVVLNQPEAVRLLGARSGRLPAYGYPEAAVAALARAVRYGEWRGSRPGAVPAFPDVDADGARAVVRDFLSHSPGGGWLLSPQAGALLRGYGIPLAAGFGGQGAPANPDRPPASGTEVFVAVEDDQMFGPLVTFGAGGAAAEVLDDHVTRLGPLTEADANAMIGSIRSAALLRGYRGGPAADLTALRDLLLRVSRLADDLPEITELELRPVLAGPSGAVAVDARVQVAPQVPQDPFLRRLRLLYVATPLRREAAMATEAGSVTSSVPGPRTASAPSPLSAAELDSLDAWWRAANYLSVGQIYLLANPLLAETLRPEHVKPRLLGHWGTTPGLNLLYAHLNRVIRNWDLDAIYVAGPGHGGPGLVANSYLEGTYTERYPSITRDAEGMRRLFRQFSFPGGIPSHAAPETPGSIHEGGELGYALAHAYGAVFDNPDLLVVCVIGDGESETGPMAGSWHSNKFLNPVTDGAVLPILHLNGYKIANPTVPARIPDAELESLLTGYGYRVFTVEGNEPQAVHEQLAATLDEIVMEIQGIQRRAREDGVVDRPRWPALVLRTPKGWTGPKFVDGQPVEGTWRAHQVPIPRVRENPDHLRQLEEWMRSYRPHELFDEQGTLIPELTGLAPRDYRRMSGNPHANGGLLLRDLHMPDFRDYAVPLDAPGATTAEGTRVLGALLRDIVTQNPDNFRLFGPDETASNRLDAVFEVTGRAFDGQIIPGDNKLARDGRVMEVLSEHLCQGWLEGYLLTGRHGLFNCYEAFIHIVDSMFNQHAKWLKTSRQIPWRRPVASLNYLLSSLVWRQDHNGFSHQDPGFIDHVVNKKAEIIRVYLPPDANCLLSVADHCLRSRHYVNVIVAGKQQQPQWLSMEEAIIHCTRGAGIWEWASSDGAPDAAPDVVMACCGDTPTLETLAAVSLMKEQLPSLKVRVVNVVDLMRLQPESEHPHGMSDAEFDALFTTDRPVIFAYHGYPSLIHRLIYRRHGYVNFHVRGYKEEGTTTTPFDMVMLNDLDRFHLVMDVIDRVPGLSASAGHVRQLMTDKRITSRAYTREFGEDAPEITDWSWPG
jgi:xylulose-5-phosphate/fructose-6-phosphate phosphoketolase